MAEPDLSVLGGGDPSQSPADASPPPVASAPTASTGADSGLAINNPLNLRPLPKGQWPGQTGVSKSGFAVFDTPQSGWAAADQNLQAKVKSHGLGTLAGIIGDPTYGWAPASDHNNPAAYASTVAGAAGVKPTDDISQRLLSDSDFRHGVLSSMAGVEVGKPVAFGGASAPPAGAPGPSGEPDLIHLGGGGAAPAPAPPGPASVANVPVLDQVAATVAHHQLATAQSGNAQWPIYDDANDVYRNKDGSIAAVGKPNAPPTVGPNGEIEMNVGGLQSQAAILNFLKTHPLDPANDQGPVGDSPQTSSLGRAGAGAEQGLANVANSLGDAQLAIKSNPVGNALLTGMGSIITPEEMRADLARGILNRNANDINLGQSGAYNLGKFGGELAGTLPLMAATEGFGGAAMTAAAPDFVAGMAPAGNLLMRAPGALARSVGRGAVQGGEAAALTSSGSSAPLPQQIEQGAAGGALINPLLGGVTKAGGALARLVAPADSNAAVQKVGNLLLNKIEADGQTADEVIAAAKANPTAPAFHAGGQNLRGAAEALVGTPGPAQAKLTSAVVEHQANAPAQIKADIGTALGGKGDYLDTLNQTLAARKLAADQGIAAIEQHPVQLNENSVSALRSPLAQGAVKEAAQNALSSADPAVREAGANLNRIADTVLDNPSAANMTVRNAQDISKSLLDAADSAYKGGNGARGQALSTLGRAIRSNAADAQPAYGSWLTKYGDDSDNRDALELGFKSTFSGTQNNSAAQVAQTLKGMSPAAQDYYRKGVAESLIQQTRTNGVNAMRSLLRNEDIQDKVKMAFPDQASYDGFLDTVKRRVGEQNANGQVIGNSRTFARQSARADLEQQPLHPLDMIPHAIEAAGHIGSLNPGGLMGQATRLTLKNLPRADRSVVGNPLTNAMLGNALTDPDTLEQTLNAATGNKMLTPSAPRANLSRNALIAPVAIAAGKLNNKMLAGSSSAN